MKFLKLALLFVMGCGLYAQQLVTTISPSTVLPGQSATMTISFVDSTTVSNTVAMQFQIPAFPGLTFGTPVPGAVVTSTGATLTCLVVECLAVQISAANTPVVFPSGVVATIPIRFAVTTVPGPLTITTLSVSGSTALGVAVSITSVPTTFTVSSLPSGIIFVAPNGQQVAAGLGRGLYYDTSTTPPSIRTLSWGGLFSPILNTVWISGPGGDAQPVDLDPKYFQLVASTVTTGRQMLTLNTANIGTGTGIGVTPVPASALQPNALGVVRTDGLVFPINIVNPTSANASTMATVTPISNAGVPLAIPVFLDTKNSIAASANIVNWNANMLYPTLTVTLTNVTGTYVAGDIVTGSNSQTSAKVLSYDEVNKILVCHNVLGKNTITGLVGFDTFFIPGESIIDGTTTSGNVSLVSVTMTPQK